MNRKKLIAKITTALFITTISIFNPLNNVQAKLKKARIYGKDRIETSIDISKSGWKDGSDLVVIAQGYNYADALCSSPLAKKYNAPILLTGTSKLSDNTLKEIKRLNAKKVIIIGGPKVISQQVEKQLNDLKINNIKRIYGANRYETSLKIAENMGDVKKVFLTSGNGYADSLSVASVAAKEQSPILFSDKNKLNDSINKFIKDKEVNKVFIIGGQSIISDNAIKGVKNTERIFGKDRFDTNKKVLSKFNDIINFEKVYIVKGAGKNGNEFADALACSVLASKNSSPIILTYNDINKDLQDIVCNNVTSLSEIVAIGGETVVPLDILNKLKVESKDSIEINKESTIFGSEKTEKVIDGDLLINADKVNLKNLKINGVLYVNPGKNGSIDIENTTAKTVVIQSGSTHGISISKSNICNLIICADNDLTVNLKEESKVNNTYVRSSATLDNVRSSFGNVIIQKENKELKKVNLIGEFNDVVEVNSNVDLNLVGKFNLLNITCNSNTNVQRDSKVKKVIANNDCKIEIQNNALVDSVEKLSSNVDIKGKAKEITNNQIKSSGAGSSSSTSASTPNPVTGQFKIVLTKDNGKVNIASKNFKLEKDKNLIDYLKTMANIEISDGFVVGIDQYTNKKLCDLTDNQRKNGVLGVDWFIYINGNKSPVGISGIKISEKDVISFDYRQWDWHEIAPDETNMPIKLVKVPSTIKSGEKFKIKATCVNQPIFDAIVRVDGKEEARTDIDGQASLKINSIGKHEISVEKDGGISKRNIEVTRVTAGGGASGAGSSSTSNLPNSLIKVSGNIPLEIIQDANNKINIKILNKEFKGKNVTILLYDEDNNLKYIGQENLSNEETLLNTKLESKTYHGQYKVSGLDKITIPKFTVK